MTWLALFLCAGAFAQTPGVVRRGEVQAQVEIRGNVIASDIFRLKSTIDGRIALTSVSTFTWYDSSHVLGVIADTELTAILDAHGSTGNDILEDRWQRIYKPTKIQCPSECLILKSFIKPHQAILAHAILIEAAKTLTMVGHVRLEDCRWVKFNQNYDFWPVKDPHRIMHEKIVHFEVTEHDPNKEPGGSITLPMSRSWYLDPGTEWEGIIHAEVKDKVLTVPSAALLVHDGRTYLPVAVSTGMSWEEQTAKITGGVDENTKYMVVEGSKLGSAARMKYVAPPQEGVVHTDIEQKVVIVPTAALIVHDGHTYLPVAVSTGIAAGQTTELIGGVDEYKRFLTLDDSKLDAATRKKYEPPTAPLPVVALPPVAPPKEKKVEKEKKDDSTLGPDPYEE